MARVGERPRGETFENLGFSFCRIATVALLTGRWCLAVSSGLCAVFFLLAHLGGKRDTRCLLRYPLLASALYGAVCVGAVWWNLRDDRPGTLQGGKVAERLNAAVLKTAGR